MNSDTDKQIKAGAADNEINKNSDIDIKVHETAGTVGEKEVGLTPETPVLPQQPVSAIEEEQENVAIETAADEEPSKREKFNFALSFSAFFSFFYKNIYYMGLMTQRYTKRAVLFLGRKLSIPLLKLAILLRLIYLILDSLYLDSIRKFASEWRFFRTEVRSVQTNIRTAFKQSPLSVFSLLKRYVKKSFERYPVMFKRIGGVLVPVAAAAVLVVTISYWNSVTFALKVTCNGQPLGYISDESVYTSAQELVKEKMESTSEQKEYSASFEEPEYKLAIVESNELTDAQTICDRIIESAKSDITSACGIYIDNEFICAIKNETDATQVFNDILDANKTNSSSDVVGFVEDVEYKQGLYLDTKETIWTTDELKDKLNTKKSEAVYYTVKEGDTVSGIAQAYGIKTAELFNMNPGLTEKIKIGQQVLVSSEVNYLRTKVVKTEVRTEAIAYQTVKTENSKLYKGTNKVTKKGVNGEAQVTELVTYIDGVRVSAEEIDRKTVKSPVEEHIDVGTKSTSIRVSSGSYTVKVTGSGMVWPVSGLNMITSKYGYRWGSFHAGVDISGPSATGHYILAAASGTVTYAGWDSGGYGYKVMINHGDGLVTLYGHCMKDSICVGVGEYVNAGQVIARVGNTGRSTGPHLHFEVHVNGSTVNPLPYIS